MVMKMTTLVTDSKESPATITFGEILANVQESRTEKFTGAHKRELEYLGKPTEDFVELAHNKIKIWPRIGDTRAVRVGPRV